MRLAAVVTLAFSLWSVATVAEAEEFYACWVAEVVNPDTGFLDQVTRCRIVGGDTVDYVSDSDVPSVLYPNLGTDVTGECWYLTSAVTAYLILTQYADGSAEIGLDIDPGSPGGIIAIGPTLPRCTSEPTSINDPSSDAWEYVMSYVHAPPTPDLNPTPGQGITGLDTYVGVAVPPDHDATLSSGASTLEIEIDVDAVIVDWGDGLTNTYPPTDTVLAGYPDGAAIHVYELKSSDGVQITVQYDWTARWRVTGGSWETLPVPNTATSVTYPIAEVVSRLTD